MNLTQKEEEEFVKNRTHARCATFNEEEEEEEEEEFT